VLGELRSLRARVVVCAAARIHEDREPLAGPDYPPSALVDEGVISEEDLDIFEFVETAEEAWAAIRAAYDF